MKLIYTIILTLLLGMQYIEALPNLGKGQKKQIVQLPSGTNLTLKNQTVFLIGQNPKSNTILNDTVLNISKQANYNQNAEDSYITDFAKLQTERVESVDTVYWQQFGPGMSGYCEEFWCHPTDVNVLFMSPDMYNSYGSWDNGESWQTIKDCDGTGVLMRRVQDIVFSRQDADFGLAIDVRGYLFESHDRGKTWQYHADFNGGGRHSALAVDPNNDNIWFMGAGDFWNVKFNHRSQSNPLGYVYNYSAYGHVLKSTDKGKTWVKKESGLPNTLDVGKIIVNPTNSNHIVMAANSGVYQSIDGGDTWSLSGNGLPNNHPRDMSSYFNSETNEFILYVVDQTYYESSGSTVISKGGVFKSVDGGENWTSVTGDLAINLNSITSFTTRDKYYNAIAYWFGKDKTTIKTLYPNYPSEILPVFNRLKVNPQNKNEIYISNNVKHDKSFGAGDVWKTEDGGLHWFACVRTGTYWNSNSDAGYWQSRSNPMGVNTKFAHIQHEMDKREEIYGNRFLEINKNGDVFICLDQQILRSVDGGDNWNQADDIETASGSNSWIGRGGSNLPGRFMLLDTGIKGRKFFCSGEHGLWESASLGNFENKTAVAVKQIEGQNYEGGATSIATVAVNPKDSQEIFILMFRQDHRGYLRKSSDGGKNWSNVSKPVNWDADISGDMMFQYNLTIDYENPNNMYFVMPENAITEVSSNNVPSGFKNFGVYKSTDKGLSWSIKNVGLPINSSVHRIKMDPRNSSVLYVALNESKTGVAGGLFKSTDSAQMWTKMNIPSVIKSVNNIHIDKTTGKLYIACGRARGNLEEGGVWVSDDNGTTWNKIFYLPYIWQVETSPLNPDLILVNAAMPHEIQSQAPFNPGAYVSYDGGVTWRKINKNLGQPDTIVDLKHDPDQEGVYWCALKGSGWARAIEKGVELEFNDPDASIKGVNKDTFLSVFPNPIKDSFLVEFELNKPVVVKVNIYNLKGVLVKSEQFECLNGKNKLLVDSLHLSPGMYILEVGFKNEMITRSLLKH